jgi:hypothetical protein
MVNVPSVPAFLCPRISPRISPHFHDAETGEESAGSERRKKFERSGDPPAVPRYLGDWAEELRLPMLLTVCIEAGRSTLTHTSWTGLAPVSRKWMSGQAASLAAALAATKDRTTFVNLIVPHSLRELTLPSARRPPSPLDFYLSWMSPAFPRIGPSLLKLHHLLLRITLSNSISPSYRGWNCARVTDGALICLAVPFTWVCASTFLCVVSDVSAAVIAACLA